jgi:pyruvate-ferredoxin/flavodoxin oxidoreductase
MSEADKKSVRITDGNEAAASVAYRMAEVIAIYPITPSSPMGESADEWSTRGRTNVWGVVPRVVEMQSEGGAAGAVHGALQAGALATTFTASQGLLLMIPNMYKIAGELTPFVMHVTARTLATHALSIFGDHSDVMACRQTGFAMLCSASVQEAHDLAVVSHLASPRSRVPFMHFFDGFRTSHELARVSELGDDVLRSLLDEVPTEEHRQRGLTPDRPVVRGTAQNPDTFFQAREACNGFYDACATIVQEAMDRVAAVTGRQYHLVDYVGHPQAQRVVILMGSGTETAHETVEWLTARGEKVGVLKVRLYRPFPVAQLAAALPPSVRRIAVLDRTKEPGAVGEPLYQDVVAALLEARETGLLPDGFDPLVTRGRYGLSSKEFTPAMVKAAFDDLAEPKPRRQFTVGIVDDVTHLSLPFDRSFDIEPPDVTRAVFFGLGADGTVGANKNSIKIIGDNTPLWPQGYFVYDSKKSGAVTISHLRFAPRPVRSAYLVQRAGFVACHQYNLLERYPVLEYAADGATFLLNAPFQPDHVWSMLPREVQKQIVDKRLRFYVIDAYKVAREAGLGGRINTVMQVCFFALSGVLPAEQALAEIKKAAEKSYAKKGADAIRRNFAAIDQSLANLREVAVPGAAEYVPSARSLPPTVPDEAPDFVKQVTAAMMSGHGDTLPVSAFPPDGTWPTGTTRWEKRAIAQDIPVWDEGLCIQCNKCAMACPHAAIRPKVYDPERLGAAPQTFKSVNYKAPDFKGFKYTLQVAPEDCTGCGACVTVCPAKDKSNPRHKAIDMKPLDGVLRAAERDNYQFFLDLPDPDRTAVRIDVKGAQFFKPLFEYSGACAGCGETPYIKLLTQLFGDRLLIANATGCSSIYGGNLPTTPYCTDPSGRGPAWANSLFEDNAEFGLGFRLAVDQHAAHAKGLLRRLSGQVGQNLADALLAADQSTEAGIAGQRGRVAELRRALTTFDSPDARRLALLADYFVKKSVWIVGGDGWAYDIGYGGLDHVLSLGHDVNVLVLDTEVYSNTGGQQSKATPLGASAKFAAAGKSVGKKDLGLMVMSYGNVYVARVAYGAKDVQTVKAFQEAESYPGPSLLIAYSHCIAHGYDMALGTEQQKLAVESGAWPLYRYDPRRADAGENPFQLDSASPKIPLKQYLLNEARFRIVEQQDPARFRNLAEAAQAHATRRFGHYEQLAKLHPVASHNGGNGAHGANSPSGAGGAAANDGIGVNAGTPPATPLPTQAAAPVAPAAPPADAQRECCVCAGGGCYLRRGGHLGVSSWR